MVEAKGVCSSKVLVLPKLQLGARTFHNSLVIHTDLKASEYGDTWKAGAALGHILENDLGESKLQDAVVLELGSGCGYAGLVASRLGAKVQTSINPTSNLLMLHMFSPCLTRSSTCSILSSEKPFTVFKQVILTDQQPLLGVLVRNVAANKDNVSVAPTVAELDWRFATHRNRLASSHGHFDYIMAGDCMYEEDCIEPLITVLKALCSPRRPASATPGASPSGGDSTGAVDSGDGPLPRKQTITKVLMSLENRGPGSAEIHATFFSKIQAWFKVEEITLECSHAQQLMRSDLRVFMMQRRGPP